MGFAKLQRTRWNNSFIFNAFGLARIVLLTWRKGKKKPEERKVKEMKTERIARKGAYVGAGVGIVLFAIFGLLPGSFLGGVMGLNAAQVLLGSPISMGIAARVIVGASMLLGVMVSCIVFVTGATTLGWLLGTAANAVMGRAKELVRVKHKA